MHSPFFDWTAARAAAQAQVSHWTAVLRALDLAVHGHAAEPAPTPDAPPRVATVASTREKKTKPARTPGRLGRKPSDTGAAVVGVITEMPEPFTAPQVTAELAKRFPDIAQGLNDAYILKFLWYRCEKGQLECVVRGMPRRPAAYRRTAKWVPESGTSSHLASDRERKHAEFRATVPMPQPVGA